MPGFKEYFSQKGEFIKKYPRIIGDVLRDGNDRKKTTLP